MHENSKSLGWANDNPDLFKRLAECLEERHDTGSENLDLTHHGYDTVYWCKTCGYNFHCDSSG